MPPRTPGRSQLCADPGSCCTGSTAPLSQETQWCPWASSTTWRSHFLQHTTTFSSNTESGKCQCLPFFFMILSRFISHKPIWYLKIRLERQILFSALVWWDLQNGKSTKYLKCVQKILGIDMGDCLSGLPKALKT